MIAANQTQNHTLYAKLPACFCVMDWTDLFYRVENFSSVSLGSFGDIPMNCLSELPYKAVETFLQIFFALQDSYVLCK